MDVSKILSLVTICVISNAQSVKVPVDHSPYCEALAKITNHLCQEVFVHMMCPRTCQMEDRIQKQCGFRKFGDTGTFESKKRKKRFDQEEDDLKQLHSRVQRIVDGKPSVKGAWPWHVALYFKGEQVCAGAIISPDWVVTAANCFDKNKTSYKESDWLIVAGAHDLSASDGTESRYIRKIVVHERNYKYWKAGYKNVPDDYDIALLKMTKPFVFNDYISPVCLTGLDTVFTSKSECKIMGWGANSTIGSRQVNLHEATVKIIPRDICNLPASYNGKIHERAICAGLKSGSADSCKYDSGGSLSCKIGKYWIAVGLVSSGYKCGTSLMYGVYTNLPLMKSWVIEILLSYDDATNSIISIFERIATMNTKREKKVPDVEEKKVKSVEDGNYNIRPKF